MLVPDGFEVEEGAGEERFEEGEGACVCDGRGGGAVGGVRGEEEEGSGGGGVGINLGRRAGGAGGGEGGAGEVGEGGKGEGLKGGAAVEDEGGDGGGFGVGADQGEGVGSGRVVVRDDCRDVSLPAPVDQFVDHLLTMPTFSVLVHSGLSASC